MTFDNFVTMYQSNLGEMTCHIIHLLIFMKVSMVYSICKKQGHPTRIVCQVLRLSAWQMLQTQLMLETNIIIIVIVIINLDQENSFLSENSVKTIIWSHLLLLLLLLVLFLFPVKMHICEGRRKEKHTPFLSQEQQLKVGRGIATQMLRPFSLLTGFIYTVSYCQEACGCGHIIKTHGSVFSWWGERKTIVDQGLFIIQTK